MDSKTEMIAARITENLNQSLQDNLPLEVEKMIKAIAMVWELRPSLGRVLEYNLMAILERPDMTDYDKGEVL